jgi:hypothetical protein
MMKIGKQKLTLDQPVDYQIKVPGHLDESWSDRAEGMTPYNIDLYIHMCKSITWSPTTTNNLRGRHRFSRVIL